MKEETYLSANTRHLRDIFEKEGFDFGSIISQAESKDVDIIKIVFLKKEKEQ